MRWNWLYPDWPGFRFRRELLAEREDLFLRQSGVVVGTVRHLPDEERLLLVIELLSTEALKTAETEGEILDRDSLQTSLRRQFGLPGETTPAAPAEQGISDQGIAEHGIAEQGIAEMLADFHRGWADPLSDSTLFLWQQGLMRGRRDPQTIGASKVHFETPVSASVPAAMTRFCQWFNATSPSGEKPLPALARAGLAHLYVESIQPLEGGNGRIGRAIAQKVLAQGARQPSLIALSPLILRRRKDYHAQLEAVNKTLDIGAWLDWFANLVLAAQAQTLRGLDFFLANTRQLDRLRGQLNPRQEKALSHLMRAGVDGFQDGLPANMYQAITGASAATGRRDLGHLVSIGALVRTGRVKGTRYWLANGQLPRFSA